MQKIGARVLLLFALLAAAGGFAACDDIHRPTSDPFLRAPKDQDDVYHAPIIKDLTRENYETYYTFLTENRAKLNEKMAATLNLKDTDPEKFEAERLFFRDSTHDLLRIIEAQDQLMKLDRQAFPDEHLAKQLALASYYLKEEIRHFEQVLFRNEPLNPDMDAQLQERLTKARELIDKME